LRSKYFALGSRPPPRHHSDAAWLHGGSSIHRPEHELTIGRSRNIGYTAAMNMGARAWSDQVQKSAAKVLSIVALATLTTASTSLSEDEFPLVGTYTENQPCTSDNSDPSVSRVKITPSEIDSVFGLCAILDNKREGNNFSIHVECKGPGGSQMLGDINFTMREDKTVDFSDQDQTYKAVLYRCP
jgi:hypothetical protein